VAFRFLQSRLVEVTMGVRVLNSLLLLEDSPFSKIFSLLIRVARLFEKSLQHSAFWLQLSVPKPKSRKFPCKIPC
jgi:hypothetical protein